MDLDSAKVTGNLTTTLDNMITDQRKLIEKAKAILTEFGFKADEFKLSMGTNDADVLINFPMFEIQTFNSSEMKAENFDEMNGRMADISNWSEGFSKEHKWLGRAFEVVSSNWSSAIVRIEDHLFAKVYLDMIYEIL